MIDMSQHGKFEKVLESLKCRKLGEDMAVYSVIFIAHGKVRVTRCRRRRSAISVGHVEDYPGEDETTANLAQGDARAMVKFLQVESIFHADRWSVCDGVERE